MPNYKSIGLDSNIFNLSSPLVNRAQDTQQYIDDRINELVRPGGLSYYQTGIGREYQAVVTMSEVGGAFSDIQRAINHAHSQGGGIVYLAPGTYTINTAIFLPSGVSLLGASPDQVQINTTNPLGTSQYSSVANVAISIIGTQVVTDGLVNVGTNTSTITLSSGTTWGASAFAPQQGDRIYFDTLAYTVDSVGTAGTSLVIQEVHQGKSLSNQTYQIVRPSVGCSIRNLTIKDSSNGGIRAYYTEDLIVENVRINDCLQSYGIFFYQCYNFKLLNTQLVNAQTGTADTSIGVAISTPLAPSPAGVGVVDGLVVISSGDGMHLSTSYTNIKNSVFSGNRDVGANIQEGSQIEFNQCLFLNNKNFGVKIASGNDVRIVNCGFGNNGTNVNNSGTNTVLIGNSPSSIDNTYLPSERTAVFNEGAVNIDFRAEGTSDANLFFIDASANSIGIGTNTPKAKFHSSSSTILGAGTSGIADGNIGNGQFNPYIDETGNLLYFKTKKSNGSILSGSISLT